MTVDTSSGPVPGDLDHISTASDFADIINSMIEQKVTTMQNYRLARVVNIAADNTTCDIVFPETPDNPITIQCSGLTPSGVGQVVLVLIVNQSQYLLLQVWGPVQFQDSLGTDLAQVVNLVVAQSGFTITATWDAIPNALKYELQYSSDPTFTAPKSVQTTGTSFTVSALNLATYYFRVRAINFWDIDGGQWSLTKSTSTQTYISDKVAPSNSPATTVYPGIGYLIAKWNPQSNADPVTYEVHVSTVNGFTPSSSTFVGETQTTYWFVKFLNDGTALNYNTTYYIRVIAKDKDGAATPGAQGSGAPTKVQTGDAGNIVASGVATDGLVPSTAPTVAISGGPNYLYVTWGTITNADPVTYEVHISTATGFTPTSSTLIGTTPSNFFFIRKQGSGAGYGDLAYGINYFVKIVPRDPDGVGPASTQVVGTPIKITGPDIAVNAIVAGSAIIADAAIGNAKIADAAITNLKVADAAISNAKIIDATIQAAKITSVYADSIITGNLLATISVTTGKLTVGPAGGKQIIIGTDSQGASGIRMYDTNGTTVLIDLNTTSTPIIQGAIIRTAATGNRWEISSTNYNRLVGWAGYAGETLAMAPSIMSQGGLGYGSLFILSGNAGLGQSFIQVYSGNVPQTIIGAEIGGSTSWYYFGKYRSQLGIESPSYANSDLVGLDLRNGASGWQVKFGTINGQWWHAGTDGSGSPRWGYSESSGEARFWLNAQAHIGNANGSNNQALVLKYRYDLDQAIIDTWGGGAKLIRIGGNGVALGLSENNSIGPAWSYGRLYAGYGYNGVLGLTPFFVGAPAYEYTYVSGLFTTTAAHSAGIFRPYSNGNEGASQAVFIDVAYGDLNSNAIFRSVGMRFSFSHGNSTEDSKACGIYAQASDAYANTPALYLYAGTTAQNYTYRFQANGTAVGGAWTTSDARVKQDIVAAPAGFGKSLIKGAKARRWKYNEKQGDPHTYFGITAQDLPPEFVQEVDNPARYYVQKGNGKSDELPVGGIDKVKVISPVDLIGILWHALDELIDEVETLKSAAANTPGANPPGKAK